MEWKTVLAYKQMSNSRAERMIRFVTTSVDKIVSDNKKNGD